MKCVKYLTIAMLMMSGSAFAMDKGGGEGPGDGDGGAPAEASYISQAAGFVTDWTYTPFTKHVSDTWNREGYGYHLGKLQLVGEALLLGWGISLVSKKAKKVWRKIPVISTATDKIEDFTYDRYKGVKDNGLISKDGAVVVTSAVAGAALLIAYRKGWLAKIGSKVPKTD